MARMKARSAKGKRVAKDTWKSKVWYDIYTPQSFGGDVIGQTSSKRPCKLDRQDFRNQLKRLDKRTFKTHDKNVLQS